MTNLLDNAAKYTPEKGQIALGIEAKDAFVEVRVKGDGIGMEPDLLASAFELFAQAKRTFDRSQGGLGLGLALVKSIVELHKGRVKAYSKGIEQGSEFVVLLPRLMPRKVMSKATLH